MNPLAAPPALPGAPAMPQSQAGPGRGAGDEAFSRCLDRAVERDVAPCAAQADRGTEAARASGADSRADTGKTAPEEQASAPDDDAQPGQDAKHGVRARGARRPGASDARGDAAQVGRSDAAKAAADLTAGAATADASVGTPAGTQAGASVEAADAEPRSIESLLPGWPALPAAAPVAAGATPPIPTPGANAQALAGAAAQVDAASAGRIEADASAGTALQAATQAVTQSTLHTATQRTDAALAAQSAQAALTAKVGAPGTSEVSGAAPDAAALPSRFADTLQAAADAAATKGPAGANRAAADTPTLPAWAGAPAGASTAVSSAAEPTRLAHTHVPAPLDSPAFAPALATQVRWLVREGMQEARLSLNPAEMGPVTVQIVIDGRDARIDFRADMAATRQALEASLPVLAAALDDSGLRLAGGGVHDGASARQGQPGAGFEPPRRGTAQGSDAAAVGVPAPTRGSGRERGLVDLVA